MTALAATDPARTQRRGVFLVGPMTDRYVQFRENQRRITRGVSWNEEKRRIELDMEEDEALNVSLDFGPIMGTGETITEVAVPYASGVTASTSISGETVTLSLSAMKRLANVRLKGTFSGGMVKVIYLRARSVRDQYYDDYYWDLQQ